MRAQRGGEQPLALLGVGLDEAAALLGQRDVAFLQHREAQQLQRLAERQQFVDLVLQRRRQRRQVGAAVVGRPASASIRPAIWLVPTRCSGSGDAHRRRGHRRLGTGRRVISP